MRVNTAKTGCIYDGTARERTLFYSLLERSMHMKEIKRPPPPPPPNKKIKINKNKIPD